MKIVVIGAGATGLALAWLLGRAGHEVTVLEAAPRPGGLLATFEPVPGCRLEYFYHHFFTHDAEINWLLGELGLADRCIFRKTSMGVYRDERLFPFNSLRDLARFTAMSPLGRVRFGMSSALLAYRAALAGRETTCALAWFERWAGRDATESIWRPMMRSKFGDAAERVPLAWMAGRLRQRARSRRGGEEMLGYLHGSLQVLVDALVDDLAANGVEIRLQSPVRSLVMRDGRLAAVAVDDGIVEADRVVSTVPTPVLADLADAVDPAYAARLRRIEYLGAICVVLARSERLSPVYWLNVADERFDFGGIIEQTNLIDPEAYGGRHLVYLSRYLETGHELWTREDDEIIGRAVDQVDRIFGGSAAAAMSGAWVFRGRYASCLTDTAFVGNIPAYRSPVEGLFVASMCHIYPDERSVNNSVRVAAEVCRAMGLDDVADRVPTGQSLSGRYGAAAPITGAGA